jgi:hypothetical protein
LRQNTDAPKGKTMQGDNMSKRQYRRLGRVKVPNNKAHYKTATSLRRAIKAYQSRQAKLGIKQRGIMADERLWNLIKSLKIAYTQGLPFIFGGGDNYISNHRIGE